jgi:hypothetical protein
VIFELGRPTRHALRHKECSDENVFAYLFSTANGEAELYVTLFKDNLNWHLSGGSSVPNAHCLHHADVDTVIILEPVKAGVGEVRKVSQ